MNFLYKLIDSFWWNVSYRVWHFWANEHISGPKWLDPELSTHSHWFTLITSSIYEPILTYWTNFWQISPPWWTFYSNSLTPSHATSAIEFCTFDLNDIFLAKEYLILKFSYITIDSIWCYFRHIGTHFLTTEHICDKLVLDDEISIQTHWLVLHQRDSSPYLT